MSLDVIDKEAALSYLKKMDAVSATGVWLAQYPAVSRRGSTVAAGRYLALLEAQEREDRANRGKKRPESKEEKHRRVLGELEELLQQEDDDDLVTALAL